MSKKNEWFISGCPICVYAEHSPRPREHCPNDGMPLVRLPGRVDSWGGLQEVKARLRPDPVLVAVAEGIRGVVGAAPDA